MSSFHTALSALKANSTALEVVGNNLANLNSTGFKASTVTFSDLAGSALNSTGSAAEGAGVTAPTVTRQFTQGGIQITGASLDAAIQGDGFFLLQDQQGRQVYTRAGNFRLDSAGNLLTASGEKVQGWVAAGGVLNPGGAATNIVLPTGTIGSPAAATRFSVTANLNSGAVVGRPEASFSTPVQVVDSLGVRHTLTISFTKTDANKWKYEVTIPGEELRSGTAGTPSRLADGTLTFGENGLLTDPAASAGTITITAAGLASGAADLNLAWPLYGTDQKPLLSQFAQPSAVSAVDQNGRSAASLVGVSVADGGRIIGKYSDGSERTVAQLALAYFRNPESLRSTGNNNLAATAGSSAPAVGTAGTGGRGLVLGGALESSTVDIAREFTNLIVYQRGYQANSRVITTVNELTQDTINLVR